MSINYNFSFVKEMNYKYYLIFPPEGATLRCIKVICE